ncbi:beta-lactamase domain protein [Gloeothece citriformis PCC 7424]|uniref:Beta-lactamase domain protein n=1 Tax=Gloeothece citriformis (strain PCC 7424) TaxID=65393 RepID=B7K891_GLOC7|nr:MBL fold metallo-hydrolase [Gloeothece citriformis]ACK69851.1 beta-lactamase domain protein [Gloeothece citriformis PCC 7424]
MKLLFLGSGSAFTVGSNNFQSNLLLITEDNKKLLIDCGSDIRFSLHEIGLSYADITDIYISHLHSDHIGGLEYIGLCSKFDPRCEKPNLYVSKDIVSDLWDRSLSGGMRFVEGDIKNLNSFFEVYPLKNRGYFVWENVKFHVVKVTHINTGYFIMPTYGLFFELNNTKILLTTDTQLCLDMLEEYYTQADIIFHDCETSKFPTSVHAHYQELISLPPSIKQKMWLYGYQPGELPNAETDGFCGFVNKGQVFEF